MKTEWDNCKRYFDNSCAYCGFPEQEHKMQHKKQLHKEHVIEGGRNDIKNCIPSCVSCNSSKHVYSLHTWYNKDNPVYSVVRYHRIIQWLKYDYKQYIQPKKRKQLKSKTA